MSVGKHLSLEEVRKNPKLLARFMKLHPEEAERARFEALLNATCRSVKRPPEGDQT